MESKLLKAFGNNEKVDQCALNTLILLIRKWGTPSKFPGANSSFFVVTYDSSNVNMLATVQNNVWSTENRCIFWVREGRISYRDSKNDERILHFNYL